jgi:predicted RNA-binding Zn ribbon-like protein
MGDVSTMKRVGGHIALDFVNTLGGRKADQDDEYLHRYAHLIAWTQGAALLEREDAAALLDHAEARPREAADALAAVLRLRSHLDAVLRAATHALPPDPGDLGALRDGHRAALAAARLEPRDGGFAWYWPMTSPPALAFPLWCITGQALDLLRFGPLDRLAECGHCRWLFLDLSRNRTRRWCSMDTCGAIVKMRRYRANRPS